MASKVSRQSAEDPTRKTTHRSIHRFPLSDSDDIDNTSSQMGDIFETDFRTKDLIVARSGSDEAAFCRDLNITRPRTRVEFR